MTAKRRPLTRWVLPNPVEPGIVACAQMVIPDSPEYRAAVRGALYSLTKPYNWSDDPLHFAVGTGERMMIAYDTLKFQEVCGDVVRPNWYLTLSLIQGGFYSDAWDSAAAIVHEDGSPGEIYTLAVWPTGTTPEIRFDITGGRRSDALPVGGYITNIDVRQGRPSEVETLQYHIELCDGTTSDQTPTIPFSAGPDFMSDFSVICGNVNLLMVTITTKGNYTCIP